ncbi:LytTR family DNA-binding domain-containing protein [Flavobacterium branchiophilum]|uniref:Two-component system response regulatory protein, LytTR family n=2 Tax=Flavobacterium branchiophilum TaxID=55197 RepID=G2Z196_FLABF|nr:LytTR family DNA-binding domain-containing protein [Flavobacterium branchiophilum]PDS26905.1 DNA-binding response regulator [Flavobacterium branchiophilum]CCB69659.1 Two-component system response regulatory protein, LytTR family [Flavobacterium branchiophilum FL-15]
MKLFCVVVDDSSIQRMIITRLVKNHPDLHLVGDFPNAIEAKNCISLNKIDLVFLDIEMPVISGFDFLDGLKNKPQIVFITSKPEYAVKAFEYDATDYLQKPIEVERFNMAVKRVVELYNLKNDTAAETGDHIFIKSNSKKLKIFINKIRFIEADGDYIKVVTDDASHSVLRTMKSFEEDLPMDQFFRIHKSYIVNLDKIVRFNGKIVEIDNIEIPLSRQKKEGFEEAIENYINKNLQLEQS